MIRICIDKLLEGHHMTQAELAKLTGIRPSTVCAYYNNVSDRINLEHFNAICKVFKCDISDVLKSV